MDATLNQYLEQIEKYLTPLSPTERADIIREIHSEMLELKDCQGLSPQQITARLGSPKELASAYLGDSITENFSFSWNKLGKILAFYSLAGLGFMFFLPSISVLAVGLFLCAAVTPLAGLVNLIGALTGFDVPIIMFQIGPYTPSAIASFPLSILVSVVLYLAGMGLWRVMIKYIRVLSARQKMLG